MSRSRFLSRPQAAGRLVHLEGRTPDMLKTLELSDIGIRLKDRRDKK